MGSLKRTAPALQALPLSLRPRKFALAHHSHRRPQHCRARSSSSSSQKRCPGLVMLVMHPHSSNRRQLLAQQAQCCSHRMHQTA